MERPRRWRRLLLVTVGVCAAVALGLGWKIRRERRAALDAQIAADAEVAVLRALRGLDPGGEIVGRYGPFRSLSGGGYRYFAGFMDLPPGLGLPRVAHFERAEARIVIGVQHGAAAGVSLFMYPDDKFLRARPDVRSQLIDSEVWFVYPDGSKARSELDVVVMDPRFPDD